MTTRNDQDNDQCQRSFSQYHQPTKVLHDVSTNCTGKLDRSIAETDVDLYHDASFASADL